MFHKHHLLALCVWEISNDCPNPKIGYHEMGKPSYWVGLGDDIIRKTLVHKKKKHRDWTKMCFLSSFQQDSFVNTRKSVMKAWQKNLQIITMFLLTGLPQVFNQLHHFGKSLSVPPPHHNYCLGFQLFDFIPLHCGLEAINQILHRAYIQVSKQKKTSKTKTFD